ncbi:hypothetical protein [Mucilaginibacter pedocola]|uniref:Uncharacterized protein n=1 Tax=Mucilaginibacter pedocola TaxID=1792845 RepID=A0A1S9PIZ5_9SPHI|nr:hypothetical protein [Mucilaginibacter pedocola]OOQ60940.1 hypothetical protein BC343_23570 [Mucilaginibacter pedocola]
MLTLKQREAKQAQKKYKQKESRSLHRLNLIVGLLSAVAAIYLLVSFRDIVLQGKWLFISAVVFCIVVVLFFSRQKYYLMYYWFLAAGAFFFFNSVFAQKEVFVVQRPIEYKYYRRNKSNSSAEVTYHRVGLRVFADDYKMLANANYAVLYLSTGLFGIEIVRDSKVIP